MSQNPGGQPPRDPYYGQRPTDPYQPPHQPSDPYFGQPPGDPYAQQQPADPDYGQQPPDGYTPQAQQQQAYYERAAKPGWPPPSADAKDRGGTGGAIVGIFLVVLGVWFLFRDEIALDFGRLWPVLAVSLGVLMVIAAFIPRRRRGR